MLDHVGISPKDYMKSKDFYAQALAPLGMKVLAGEDNHYHGFGVDRPIFWIGAMRDGATATQKSHIAFSASNHEAVDAFYVAALAAGGTDNGAPGPRPEYHEKYYGAFVLDPDGNNIEAVCHV